MADEVAFGHAHGFGGRTGAERRRRRTTVAEVDEAEIDERLTIYFERDEGAKYEPKEPRLHQSEATVFVVCPGAHRWCQRTETIA